MGTSPIFSLCQSSLTVMKLTTTSPQSSQRDGEKVVLARDTSSIVGMKWMET